MNDVAYSADTAITQPIKFRDPNPYPSISRPNGVMTISMFAYVQRTETRQYMQALIEECRRLYLYSTRVTGAPDPSFTSGTLIVDLSALMYPWDKLCCWYRDNIFCRQMDLFRCPYQHELSRWHTFVLERSFEPIYDDPGRVRLLLATVGLIPAKHGEFEYYADFEDSGGEPLFGWAIAEHAWRTRDA